MYRPQIVGISGLSGSGKTLISAGVAEKLGAGLVSVLQLDDYYKPRHLQKTGADGFINFDEPDALDWKQYFMDLQALAEGKMVLKSKYPFENNTSEKEVMTIEPAPVILADGLFVFSLSEIDVLCTHRVMVEANENICLERRLERDVKTRGISREKCLYQWHNHVFPAWEAHILPHRNRCDFICENNGDPKSSMDSALSFFESILP